MSLSKQKKLKIFLVAGSILLVIFIIGWIYTAQRTKVFQTEQFIMDTIVSQTVYGPNAEKAADTVNEQLRRFETQMSMHLTDSEISKINANAGIGYVKVSQETFDLVSAAKSMSAQSEGFFDVTIGPLTSLWGITSDHPRVPSVEEIESAKELVNYNDILLDEKNTAIMLRREGQSLDMGGIAKGMATDMVREIYQEMHISSANISLGGNVLVVGKHPSGRDFIIGIRDPRGTANEYIATVSMEGKVNATTGDYERYFEQDGKRYHHVLDPRTGYPCETDLIQATAICENGMLADFLSTTLFMMGKENVLAMEENELFDYIIVDKDKNVYVSQGLKDVVKQNEEKTEYTFYSAVTD